MKYDVIIIGSGAGGSAAAYHLTQTGRRVLLLEKGDALPRDGSTLDVATVMRRGDFISTESWQDRSGRMIVPEEHFNLGGKTKWYGAALLRFGAPEFEADPQHRCLPWPIGYDDLAPYYDEAERLLGVRTFSPEPALERMFSRLERTDPRWRRQVLNLGLSAEVLNHPVEAAHFDGFASVRGLKADAEDRLLERVRQRSNLEIATRKGVAELVPAAGSPLRIAGVECEDGSRYQADLVLLAAGALHSPRLLQRYLEATGLADRLPAYRNVGRNFKLHVLTAMLAFTTSKVEDVLSKTMLLTHAGMPHSTVQTLGGNLASEIVRTQTPAWLPGLTVEPLARRAIGLFLQTEDGSHPDNRVLAAGGARTRPLIDHDPARLPEAYAEHRELTRMLKAQLLRLGYLPVTKAIPITGTAHVCGTLVAGRDPSRSVVDGNGRVHGMENLYVVDGSVLPRSSRVNPALTIYAWGLRVASLLESRVRTRETAVVS